jgi:DNA-binding beta-propeller fold protein YncE
VAGGDVVAVDAESDRLRGYWTDYYYYATGLFADSAQGKLYCLSAYPPLVSVIDPFANKVLNTIALSGYPEAMAFNPVDHKAYVAGESYVNDGGSIVALDAVGDSVLTEIAVGRALDFLAYDADDDLLYAASSISDCILAIDGKTDSIIDTIKVSEDCGGLVYNAARHRVYSLSSMDEVTAFTPRVHGQNKEMFLGAALEDAVLNASGTKLFCAGPDENVVYVLDCVSERLAGEVSLHAPPAALCCAAPYDEVYVAYGEEGQGISVMDCSQRIVRATIPVDANSLYWDPGTDAVYCLNDTCFAVVDGGTRRVVARLNSGRSAGLASVPGWPRVYVYDDGASCLTVIRTDQWLQVRGAADVRATVVRRSLVWTGTSAAMYDMGGRRVADVRHGKNDVSRLSPGVYFVRQSGVRPGTFARKVVVAR